VDIDFIKADLHIHTPASQCYSDPSVTPEQIVEAALDAGLGAIAVTDHNSVSGVERIRALGVEKGLTVFPGMELSARGGHVLALFDPGTPIRLLDEFLHGLGVGQVERGDATMILGVWIEDVFRRVDEGGGIAVAAHIERWPSGFLVTSEHRKVKAGIHSSPYLSALEITQPRNKSKWNEGKMPGYPRPYACIQDSDAHAPNEIGRRATYLKLPGPDLEGLRTAFKEHAVRIRFPEEPGD